MASYIIRRIFLIVPTLFGITLIVFVVMAASPGGISAQSLIDGQNLEPKAKQALEAYYNHRYGLDQPAPIQYLRWLNNLSPVGFAFNQDNKIEGFHLFKTPDLGVSFRYGRPVLDLLIERVPITLLLNLLSVPIVYLIAIGIGVRAATQRGQPFDVYSSFTMLALWSVPTMLAGVLLIAFFASDQYWHWFPTAGLSARDALDMPFLPHGSSAWDVLMIVGLTLAGTALLAGIGAFGARTLRVGIMASLGIVVGVLMARQVAANAWVLSWILAGVLGGSLGVLGATGYTGLRVAGMANLGAIVGMVGASSLIQGEFVRGFLVDRLWHLVLPVLCLSYGGFAFLSKLTRAAVLENLLADYARTARAKGVSEQDILWRHVFRNSLLPLITVSATLLPGLLAGSVIVETIFSIEGMGRLAVEAVQGRDRELVLSVTLLSGLLTLVGYLIADIGYAIADPRVSYE